MFLGSSAKHRLPSFLHHVTLRENFVRTDIADSPLRYEHSAKDIIGYNTESAKRSYVILCRFAETIVQHPYVGQQGIGNGGDVAYKYI